MRGYSGEGGRELNIKYTTVCVESIMFFFAVQRFDCSRCNDT